MDPKYTFVLLSLVSLLITVSIDTMYFQGGYVSVQSIKGPEDLVRLGSDDQDSDFDAEDALETATRTIKKYRKKYKYRQTFLRGEEYRALEPVM